MWRRRSFSTVVGGTVRGKDVGIARGIIIQVGATIDTFRLFIETYHPVGDRIIGSVTGKGINGTTKKYPTDESKATGETGKKTNIGRSNKLGAFKA